MTMRALFSGIESNSFSARVGVASDLSTFSTAIRQEPSVTQLLSQAVGRARQVAILARLVALTASRPDPRYEHPHDAAIATYLWVLLQASPAIARLAAERAIEAPQTWWALRIGREILLKDRLSTPAGSSYSEISLASSPPMPTYATSQSGESFFFATPLSDEWVARSFNVQVLSMSSPATVYHKLADWTFQAYLPLGGVVPAIVSTQKSQHVANGPARILA